MPHFPSHPARSFAVPGVLGVLTAAILLLLPASAWAWGAGAHLVTGNLVLDNLHLLAPALAALLKAHRNDFLYGALSADILIGKGVKKRPDHCHNWDKGFELLGGTALRLSDDPALKAYAWGYLAHLAADVVAHNFYVPNMLHAYSGLKPLRFPMPLPLSLRTADRDRAGETQCDSAPALKPGGGQRGRGRLSHVYVEMLADAKAGCCWQQAQAVFSLGSAEEDDLLRGATKQGRLSFGFKKRIFQGGLSVVARAAWRNSLCRLDRNLPLYSMPGGDAHLVAMLELASSTVLDLLRNPESSVVREYDPIGADRLALVTRPRRKKAEEISCPLLRFPIDERLSALRENYSGVFGSGESGAAGDAARTA